MKIKSFFSTVECFGQLRATGIWRHSGLSKILYSVKPNILVQLTKKSISTFYIGTKANFALFSGELPRNTDQELWKDENAMNLYFNFDHAPEDNNGVNIASATLRLYRLPNATNNPLTTTDPECENPEDDRLLRVSIYWYTRSLRKHRGNRIGKQLVH